VPQKTFVVPAQKGWAYSRLEERLTTAVSHFPAQPAELAGFEPEPDFDPAERFDAGQPALVPAASQEVESEPSVWERWNRANLGLALAAQTAEQRPE
jgi:hypothetical protein